MISRFVIIILVAFLAIPTAALTRPTETSGSAWGEVAAAKGKKDNRKKDNGKKRKQTDEPPITTEPFESTAPLALAPAAPVVTTVTRTVRQPLTLTFASAGVITIPSGAPGVTQGPASPYPSTIAVSGFANGTITDVNLILSDFTHAEPYAVDILLSASDGRQALVMSDVGSSAPVTDIDLTLDDEAAASLKDFELIGGTFRPTNFNVVPDQFAAPAPALTGMSALTAFDGANPNGTWQLWVMDNQVADVGELGGWALQITAEVDVQVQEQVVSAPAGLAPGGQDTLAPGAQDSTKTKKHAKNGKKDVKKGKKSRKGKNGRR
jgi:hypothetical protein